MPAYCPGFEKPLPGADYLDFNGKGFAKAFDELEKKAHAAGVTALSAFHDTSASYGEDIDPPDFEPGPTPWFPPADGLATVSALVSAVKADPESVPDPDLVLGDLEDFRRFLEIALPLNIGFNMWWDI